MVDIDRYRAVNRRRRSFQMDVGGERREKDKNGGIQVKRNIFRRIYTRHIDSGETEEQREEEKRDWVSNLVDFGMCSNTK